MKKILTVLVLLFVSSIFSFAQNTFEIDASLRLRSILDNKEIQKDNNALSYTEMRTRLGVSFFAEKGVSGFIQAQDSRVFGTEPNTLANTQNLDLHQGYMTVDNLFGLPVEMKAGRMEVAYANERLIGSVGWSNVGRSFDGGVFRIKGEESYFDVFGYSVNESFNEGDISDAYLFGLWGVINAVRNYTFQPFILFNKVVGTSDNDLYTIGIYEKGINSSFIHQIEFAYQTGKTTIQGEGEADDVAAFMAVFNFSYAFEGKYKPVLSAGIDYLSGDDDYLDGEFRSFNTLYATNHKFYGYMDYFTNIPLNTLTRGLMDIHGQAGFVITDEFGISAKYHHFRMAEVIEGQAGEGNLSSFGDEIDITASYKYSQNYLIQGGFSVYFPGNRYDRPEDMYESSTTWAYLMGTVAF